MLWPKTRNCICKGFTWQEQEQPRTGDRVSEQLAVTGSASPFCDHLLYIVIFPISKTPSLCFLMSVGQPRTAAADQTFVVAQLPSNQHCYFRRRQGLLRLCRKRQSTLLAVSWMWVRMAPEQEQPRLPRAQQPCARQHIIPKLWGEFQATLTVSKDDKDLLCSAQMHILS